MNYRDIVLVERVVSLLQVVLVDTPIVPEVPVVVEVPPNRAAVHVEHAVVLVYATRGVLVAVLKEVHAPKTHENGLISYILSCRSMCVRRT